MEKKPVYSPKQIFAGSFLGGPIAMVYFLRNNFQNLGNTSAATQTLWWGILFNIAIVASLPFLPSRFPNYVIPIVYSLTARRIASAKQMEKESIAASTEFCFQSNWKVVGLSVAFLLIALLVWFAAFFLLIQFRIINPD